VPTSAPRRHPTGSCPDKLRQPTWNAFWTSGLPESARSVLLHIPGALTCGVAQEEASGSTPAAAFDGRGSPAPGDGDPVLLRRPRGHDRAASAPGARGREGAARSQLAAARCAPLVRGCRLPRDGAGGVPQAAGDPGGGPAGTRAHIRITGKTSESRGSGHPNSSECCRHLNTSEQHGCRHPMLRRRPRCRSRCWEP
jgi:hypothetical protein